ncbi:hypothetical protein EW026_g3026 [Hermanssonia centrifuga]|uniref:Inositol-1-monophosphatase n=1 Tax=Hermanssonia centrifuga TaxID=98765 RepID=A0A4V3XAT2_9APHY|nr:hypothetical protein EW026_g3026 [Hermanssonia centrifuga]
MASKELSTNDLQEVLTFTLTVAKSAGNLILEGSKAILASGNVDEKKNSVDLVTEYDVRVEELVKGELNKQYPTFQFIGEESYAAGSRPPLSEEPTFCVDPIDGTTNFVHGFPHVCVSIGLIYKKSPVLGVIYNPFLDQLYYATKGRGAFLVQRGSEPLKLPLSNPRPLPSLSQALLGIEWGSDRSASMIQAKGEAFKLLAGSAALNYAMVAQGGLDIYWEIGCWPWDICAGAVIAQEAGCLVAGSHSSPLDNHVGEEVLNGRKYIVIRAIGDSAVGVILACHISSLTSFRRSLDLKLKNV